MKIKISEELADEFLNYCHKHEACKDCKYNVNVGHNSCSNAFFYDKAIDECIKIAKETVWKDSEMLVEYFKELKAGGKNERN